MNTKSNCICTKQSRSRNSPSDAVAAGAIISATGRSDFVNQINNAVVFPSILRALLDLRINSLDEDMLVSVATAIAGIVDDKN